MTALRPLKAVLGQTSMIKSLQNSQLPSVIRTGLVKDKENDQNIWIDSASRPWRCEDVALRFLHTKSYFAVHFKSIR